MPDPDPLVPEPPSYRQQYFPTVPDESWESWQWQFQMRCTKMEDFARIFTLTDQERQAWASTPRLPAGSTPYYLSLVPPDEPDHPLRRTIVPTVNELVVHYGEALDPLGEEQQSPIACLVHRYPDRCLLLATETCSMYCRYCTRSRAVGHGGVAANDAMEEAFDYIARHSEIRDVVVSGGDPLTLHDNRIDWILYKLRSIPHVEIIRIGTKVPVVLPQRITPDLCNILAIYHPVFINIHFTHPLECTDECRQACVRLANAGIPLGSQTVLLKGVNDSAEILGKLFKVLLKQRVRPYYLYQCDPIMGSAHFRTAVQAGVNIMDQLRGRISGLAMPNFVVDAPGGGGKIPITTDNLIRTEAQDVVLRNYLGQEYRYPTC